MKFTPRPYQRLIVNHILSRERTAVWAGMGMGKTSSTLYAINLLQSVEGVGPALILAPLRVAVSTWPDEVAKWEDFSHMRVSVLYGSKAQRKKALNEKADIYCVNYESLPWLVEELDGNWPFDIIVADEATRLKSFRTRSGGSRAKALGSVAWRSEFFIELTGTPASNGLLDLWGQFWFLDKGERLGKTMRRYQEVYFTPIRVGANAFAVKYEPRGFAEKAILEKTQDIALKLNAEDWFDIQKPIVMDVEVTLDEKVMKAYRSLERNLYVELGEYAVDTANAATKTSACLQLASGNLYEGEEVTPDFERLAEAKAAQSVERVDGGTTKPYFHVHDSKLRALASIVEEANGMPILVAYQFKHERDRILSYFKGSRVLDKNPQTIRDWNAGKIPMLLAHPASCGHGLSMQDGGNILVFYSTGWNLEEHEQIIERIGPTRQAQAGHTRPVFVYNIIAKDTLDEAVQERITTKRSVLDLLMERRKA